MRRQPIPLTLGPKAELAVSCIDLPTAAGLAGVTWEPFQLGLLNNETRYGIDVKARQIAWSFIAAVDAVVDSVLVPDSPHIFVSINQDEATEKIRYALSAIEAWHNVPGYPKLPPVVRANMFAIEFANRSRLLSHPCRPPRGKARTRIYLDEMAHYRESLAREIYTAALPATTKGDGYIRIGSSPLGAGGMFWEIVTESMREYPGYKGHRRYLPWWTVRYLCNDVDMARAVAPYLPTEERVDLFGTDTLKEIYQNMFIEDFQQEYECAWVDESVAWITWDTIKKNQAAYGNEDLFFKATGKDAALHMLKDVQTAMRQKKIESVFCGGIDIGRVHDRTEFMILGKGTTENLPLRAEIELHNTEYDDQYEVLLAYMRGLPFTKVLVDRNGLGAQLAENLEKATSFRAQGVDFTNPNKELWAVEARIQAERAKVPLPSDRDIAYQIHSIKKLVTSGKNNSFDAERNATGHADKFWGWALGVYAGVTKHYGGGVVV